jgi:aspartate/methionine/tyrosine aminotransferase
VAIAAYGDEAHVEENRRLYAQKFDLADQIIGDRYGYRRPAGGFFLWLDVSAQGGDETVALRLWREAGLRIGFAAGDRQFLARFLELRNVSAPQVPMPAQRVAIAAYGDEAHVEENRRLYAQKFDLADQIIGDRYGYRRPAGGFFLWLDVSAQGGDEAVALRLWREAGLRVVPGRYLARDQADGSNPGLGYIRVAMVQDQDTTAQALHRLVAVLG